MTTKSRAKRSGKRSLANEVFAVVLVAVAVLLLLSLVTFNPNDPNWNLAGTQRVPSNLIGVVGAHVSDLFLQLFGLASLAIPILLCLIAVRVFFSNRAQLPLRKVLGAFFLLIALSGFLALFPKIPIDLLTRHDNGGLIGHVVEAELAGLLNTIGAAIVLGVAAVLTLMLTMEVSLASAGKWAWSKIASRIQTSSGEPTALSRLGARWLHWVEQRRLLADERQAERAAQRERDAEEKEQRRQEELERRERAREVLAVEHRRRAEEDQGRLDEPAVLETAGLASEPQSVPDQMIRPDIQPAVVSARGAGAAAVRAYKAKVEQERSGQPPDITIDPDVAEMVSTASIVRTMPLEKDEADAVSAKPAARRKTQAESLYGSRYELPALDLLEAPMGYREQAEEELRERATILAEKCKEFSVVGHIHRINPGPVVTTFEFKPDPGVKYNRVVGLAEDLCLALKAESIRIDRIPGKSTVGIEVPNAHRETIYLRDVIESSKFQQAASKLTIALGKTINGEEYVADLTKMPHLLIAGATGAGKSVTLNTIICSILYKASPEEVKFIMVDPKRLELGLYEGIPHLLTPIVTDPKRAANALRWAVNEMESRYKVLAGLGVRNIEQYNRQVRELLHPTLWQEDPNALKPLPFIVIAIDELADLMMVARGDVETSIARLAQMARAVGIHLVLATQRPSVDVITGIIKANFPSRIAFRVSSKVDSRTIIDSNGAEALLGQGDMLFLPPASARLIRVHGSLVNEAEVKRITDHSRKQAQPDYNEQVTMSEQEAEDTDGFAGERDELYDEALAIVTDMSRASTSVLQRRLSIGYGRAAKILDTMEREGFIGPAEGAKPRKVLSAAYEFRERVGQRLEESGDA
jgi:DNA segregation ATPase FtsK/SpoIIIE, S-DNA-T family